MGFAVDFDRMKVKLVWPFINPFCPLGVPLPTEEHTAISLSGKARC